MANFYVKNDSDEYVEASEDQINELFKEKSDKIVSAKLKCRQEKMRAELEAELREKMGAAIKGDVEAEIKQKLESEYQAKLAEAESKSKELDVQLRRKTIAAEYGFKPEAEKYLGSGTDEEMRAEADVLKNSFGHFESSDGKIEKKTSEPVNTGCVTLCDS